MSEARHAVWLVPVADLGGVARHVLDATRVGVPGWRITVLCPHGALAEALRAQGSVVVTAPFGPAAGMWASRRALSRAINALQPDIVHSHLAYADIINAWTRLPRHSRRVTTEHGIAGHDAVYHRSSVQAKAMALIHGWRFRRFDRAIAVSRATRDAMVAKWHVKQPIAVIHNGVDPGPETERRTPESLTGMRILSLSRLAPEKQIDKLIDAFALVQAERPDATLTIAGEGPLRHELHARNPEIHLPGFVDAEAAMRDADVIVQLSVWENCSYTLLDAVARGLRIVASDVGGNGEILDPASLVTDVSAQHVAQAILTARVADPPKPASVAEMCAEIAREYQSVVK